MQQWIEQFLLEHWKTKTYQEKVNIIIKQWELKVKTGILLEAQENMSDQVGISINVAFDWLRWLCKFF